MTTIDINTKIAAYLTSRRQLAIDFFKTDHPVLTRLMAELLQLDLVALQTQNEAQLRRHSESSWPITDEPIDGILFEHDYFFKKDTPAEAYGITFGDFRADQFEAYGFGWYSVFADGFYAVPGIVLNTFDSLIALNGVDSYGTPDFQNLVDACRFTAFLVLHRALANFSQTGAFQKLNRLTPFHFVIQEHDQGFTYPLYVIQ